MPGYDEDKGGEQNGRVDRRKFLKCMAWTGTGLVWTVSAGGLLTACGDLATATSSPTTTTANSAATTAATSAAPTTANATTMAPATTSAATTAAATTDFTFVQLSDTHIGFNGEGINTDVVGTARQSIEHINALATRPALVIHTGDVSHNSKPSEFDTAYQLMNTIKTDQVFYVPGEHDLLNDKGAAYNQRFQKGGKAWYSMDFKGVHFIALSNSGELDAFGKLGSEQLDWLKQDLAGVKKDSSIVVFAHVPLYSLYPEWGWETKDADQAMQLLMPYSAVTVLNGHIHQVLSKVEGNITFYTANATAFPQHRPGVEKPNAYKLPASDLLRSIGYRTVTITPGKPGPQIVDTTLAGTPAETVGPVTVSTSTTTTPNATTAPVATVATKTGQVDAGPLTDFSATTPKQVTFNQADQKGATTLFVVQNGKDYLALSDICTHQGCEVNWSQSANLFLCPCHGSQYDLQGKNVGGPAPKPLSRYKTEVVDGHLVITLQA